MLLVGLSVPALAANSYFVVVDSVKNCAVVEARPGESLTIIGEKDGYATKDEAKKALAEIRKDDKQCAGVVE
jgi:hypothetical protein